MMMGGGATAVGRGASHSRPATSFFWFTNPWKSFKYIIWKNYKWQILGVFLLLLLGLTALWTAARRPIPGLHPALAGQIRRAAAVSAGTGWAQASIGVATLLTHVPVPLASAHQLPHLPNPLAARPPERRAHRPR